MAPTRGIAARDPAATKAAILAATLEYLDEVGESGIRVAAVASRAGVTTGAIYGHFNSREGLLAAAQLEYLRGQLSFIRTDFDAAHTDQEAAAQSRGPACV